MKIEITARVTDKETGEVFTKGINGKKTIIERSKERGQAFINAGVAVEYKPVKEIEVEAEEVKEEPKAEKSKKKRSKKSK